MPLNHPRNPRRVPRDLDVPPIFTAELERVPRDELPAGGMPPDAAYQIIHDELMLDGNARLNLATFVTTWMEPQADRLMAETFDKNMIDKDEYPQTAELELRCVNMLSRLWHAPAADGRRWAARPRARARPACWAASPSSAAGRSAGGRRASPPTAPTW